MQQADSPHRGVTSGPGLTFPVKLRCGTVADLCAEPGLEDALARALGRAFATAQAALPAALALGQGVVLNPPQLINPAQVDARDADQVLQRVRRAIEAAARARSLPLSLPGPGERRTEAKAERSKSPGTTPAASERFDPARFDAHDATYEIPSYDGGKTKAEVAAKKDPRERLKELYAAEAALLDALIEEQQKFAFGDLSRVLAVAALRNERKLVDAEKHAVLNAVLDPGLLVSRAETLEAAITLIKLVRPRVHDLNKEAALLAPRRRVQNVLLPFSIGDTKTDRDFLRDADIELGDAYLALPLNRAKAQAKWTRSRPHHGPPEKLEQLWFRLIHTAVQDSFERWAFLDAYYSNPSVLMGVASMRYAQSRLLDVWDQLGKLRPKPFPDYVDEDGNERPSPPLPAWPALEDRPVDRNRIFPSRLMRGSETLLPLLDHLATATKQAAALHFTLGHAVAMPLSLSEVGPTPSDWAVKQIAAQLYDLQISVAVFALWQNLPNVRRLLVEKFKVSPPGLANEVDRLEDAFIQELGPSDPIHKGIDQRAAQWERDVKKLYADITDAVKREAYLKAFITFALGLVLTFGVSAWLQAAFATARVTAILGEGVALEATLVSTEGLAVTAINTGLGAMQGAKLDWKHLGADFVVNTALVALLPVLRSFKGFAEAEQNLARVRPLLTALGEGVAQLGVGTLAQLGVARLLDDEARRQGGETATTETLTMNLMLNTWGLLVGLSLIRFTKVPAGAAPVTAEVLVRQLREEGNIEVSVDSAKKLLDLQGQIGTFQKSLREAHAAASAGTLTPHQYEMWQARGRALLVELEEIPDLAGLLGGDLSTNDVTVILGRMRDLLRQDFRPGLLLATPQALGLDRVGEGPAWLYDPRRATDPARFDKLKARFDPRSVRELPGGGWEAVDSTGRTVIQVLPAGPALAEFLEPPLRVMFTGGRAQTGAELIEGQNAAPELSSLFKRLAGSDRTSTQRILKSLSRPGGGALTPQDANTWRSLANYLRQGGDPKRLALVLTFREGTISAEANNNYARAVLARLGDLSKTDFPKTSRLLHFTGKATQEGLAAAQTQPFANNLEVLLEAAAAKSPDAVKTLLPTLRLLNPKDSNPWVGLQKYLERDGDVAVLNRALGFRGQDVGQFRPDLVNQAMAMMGEGDWSQALIRGLAAYDRLNATAASRGRRYANLTLLSIAGQESVASALADLAALEPKIDTKDPTALAGIRKVLSALSADDMLAQAQQLPSGQTIARPTRDLGNAPNITGAVGALRAGAVLAGEFVGRDTFLRFESPQEVVNQSTGEVLGRVYDIVVLERGAARGPGKLPPPEKVIARVEAKWITSTASLATPRVHRELATDIVADINLRAAAVRAGLPEPSPFSKTRWFIRANELRAQAIADLIQADRIDAEMHDRVRKALAPALSDSALAGLDVSPYRQLLANPHLQFVTFVDGPPTEVRR